jgi:hypothetical protein
MNAVLPFLNSTATILPSGERLSDPICPEEVPLQVVVKSRNRKIKRSLRTLNKASPFMANFTPESKGVLVTVVTKP